VDTVQTVVKFLIHLHDMAKEEVWEEKSKYVHLTEFCTDLTTSLATLIYYLYILVLHGVSFTVFDVVLLVQMRTMYNTVRSKVLAFQSYRKLNQMMKDK
tara:strand:+ start:117 stop:413 length:297 start_codon:yes stop_codon:yes gene_type:complete